MALPVYNYDQIAYYLTDTGLAVWGETRQKFDVMAGGTITYSTWALNDGVELFADAAFDAWSAVSGLNFEKIDTYGVFGDISITHGEEYNAAYSINNFDNAGNIAYSDITISEDWIAYDWGYVDGAVSIDLFSYTLFTFIHEIGHSLGLAHAGNYDGGAAYPTNAVYANDSWQVSVMSYFSQEDNTYIDADYALPMTPMIADIVAIQDLYGSNFASNPGATIYGRGGNTGTYVDQLWQADVPLAMTLFDTGGVDTLDLGYSNSNQRVDLNAEGISDVAGLDGNLVIARNTVIERAITGAGSDEIIGNAANNMLAGGDGADLLYGAGGRDMLHGDGFSGAYSAWSDDIFRLYQATLGRAPDVAGHTVWVERLESGARSLEQAAAGFVGSAEFQATYGSLSNAAFVDLLYQNVLGREGDALGVQTWADRMAAGTSRADVVLGFSQSAEFVGNTTADAALFDYNSVAQNWVDDVYRLYRATLDRAPDDAGLTGWAERLADGRSYLDAAEGFVNSAEFRATYGTGLSNTEFVTLLYENVLDRAPDANGLQGWINAMNAGASRADVVRGFAQSGEFIADTRGELVDFMQDDARNDANDDNADIVDGGAGNDMLIGGLGIDAFVFNANENGADTIADFELWDVLVFEQFGYSRGSDALAHMSQSGADVVFSDQGVRITIENAQLSEMSVDHMSLDINFA